MAAGARCWLGAQCVRLGLRERQPRISARILEIVENLAGEAGRHGAGHYCLAEQSEGGKRFAMDPPGAEDPEHLLSDLAKLRAATLLQSEDREVERDESGVVPIAPLCKPGPNLRECGAGLVAPAKAGRDAAFQSTDAE